MAPLVTALQSHGVVDCKASQTYGNGKTILRIGNGGAGATGLIEALANHYLKSQSREGSIEWVCNHSRNTQLALFKGCIDIALTYERDQEALAASEGWSVTAGCVFHDHFCLAGPALDPAGISSTSNIVDAFRLIEEKSALFHSRADFSATMWKEYALWSQSARAPWNSKAAGKWYRTSTLTPAEALIKADTEGAYLLTDRSTILRQTALGNISNSTVFVEPAGPQDVLMNSCYALHPKRMAPKTRLEVEQFLQYLRSPEGQGIISSFGVAKVGIPFFACVEDGYAKASLIDGQPRQGKWKAVSRHPRL